MQPPAARAQAIAIIDERACIGCTLCIGACPVDAIVGAQQLMHTVIADECIGCRLCVPPCPVDCIEMVAAGKALTRSDRKRRAERTRLRYSARLARLERERSQRLREARTAGAQARKQATIERVMRRARERLR
jgi:electron transport complex protein RnfB